MAEGSGVGAVARRAGAQRRLLGDALLGDAGATPGADGRPLSVPPPPAPRAAPSQSLLPAALPLLPVPRPASTPKLGAAEVEGSPQATYLPPPTDESDAVLQGFDEDGRPLYRRPDGTHFTVKLAIPEKIELGRIPTFTPLGTKTESGREQWRRERRLPATYWRTEDGYGTADWNALLTAATDGAYPDVRDADGRLYTESLTNPSGSPRRPLLPGAATVLDDLGHAAGFWALARSSLAPGTEDKIKRLAAARFPDLPLSEAVKRYGVADGNIVYKDPATGRLARSVPSWFGDGPLDTFFRFGDNLAARAGQFIPEVVGGLAGGLIGGGPWSIPVAAGVAGAVDLGRQSLDRTLAGEHAFDIDPWNAAGHAATAGLAQSAAVAGARLGSRNRLRVSRTDRKRPDMEVVKKKARHLQELSDELGVPLTIGEKTGLASLLNQERQLQRFPETADKLRAFFDERNRVQVPNAVSNFLLSLSPVRSSAAGTRRLAEGAEAVLDAARQARADRSGPLYRKAFDEGAEVDIGPVLGLIDDQLRTAKGGVKKALTEARSYLFRDGSDGVTVVDTNLAGLHGAKVALDDLIEGRADNAVGRTARAKLIEARNALLDAMENASPTYRKARLTDREMSPAVAELQTGGVAAVSKADPTRPGQVRALFDPRRIVPEAVAGARSAFAKAGRLDDWNAGLRTFLEDRFEDTARTLASGRPANIPGKFTTSLFGDKRSREVMEAAMSSQQFQGFRKLMEVFEAAARTLSEGSPTATDVIGARQLRARYGAIGRGLSNVFSPQNLGTLLGRAFGELRAGRQLDKLADAVTSPEAVDALERLRTLNPRSERARTLALALLLNVGGGSLFAATRPRPADAAPPAATQ